MKSLINISSYLCIRNNILFYKTKMQQKRILYLIISLLLFQIVSGNSFITFLTISLPIAEKTEKDNSFFSQAKVDYSLIRFLEASGGSLITVHTYTSRKEISHLLKNVNAVILQGADTPIKPNTPYYQTVKFIYEEILEIYVKSQGGTKVPIFALGNDLALLSNIVSDDITGSIVDTVQNIPEKIIIEKKTFSGSKLFSQLIDIEHSTIINLENFASDLKYAIQTKYFEENFRLSSNFKVILATKEGSKTYAAMIEGKNYPLYGISFKPEMIPFEHVSNKEVPISLEAIRINRGIGNAIVYIAAENRRVMTEEEKKKFECIPHEVEPVVFKGKLSIIYKNDK